MNNIYALFKQYVSSFCQAICFGTRVRWSDKQRNCLLFTNHLNPASDISVTFGWVPWYLIVIFTYGFPFPTTLCVDTLEPSSGHLTVSTCIILQIKKYNSNRVAATIYLKVFYTIVVFLSESNWNSKIHMPPFKILRRGTVCQFYWISWSM